MCDVLLYLILKYYDIRSQAGVCQWSNCHSKTWQALLQKITDIIFRQGEWRSLFSSATPHPLFFVTLIIRHILIGINMKYDTFFSGTVWVAHGSQCDIIKVWKGWFPFILHKVNNLNLQIKSGLGTRSFFCASWKTVYKWLRNAAGQSMIRM